MSDIDTTLPTATGGSALPIVPSATVAGSTVSAMHDVEVLVTSPEAALDGVAEFRSHGRLLGFTLLQAGELVLELAVGPGEEPLQVNAHSLSQALLKAKALLT